MNVLARKNEYLKLHEKYLSEAQELLVKKDYAQASEKLWGAAAEIVKAVAAGRETELGTHASVWAFVEKLDQELPDRGLIDGFSYAGNLHTNFYENWLSPRYVQRGLEIVKKFSEDLHRIL